MINHDMKLSAVSKIIRNPSILTSVLDDDLIMMDEKQGYYYRLHTVAKKIWELLDSPKNYQDLIDALMSFYVVSRERCEHDVASFLAHLIQNKLINIENAD